MKPCTSTRRAITDDRSGHVLRHLVDEWVRGGITDAVVAPGSRSTPIALALAATTEITCTSCSTNDQPDSWRSGSAWRAVAPALVVTTSGTAVAELRPAVVEAHHARVPLLVVSADRPWEAQDGRALRRPSINRRCSPALTLVTPRARACRTTARAARGGRWRRGRSLDARRHPLGPGPVHLNLAFREPLLGDPDELPSGPRRRSVVARVRRRACRPRALPLDGSRGLVVAGAGAPACAARCMRSAGRCSPIRVRAPACPHDLTVAAADELLRVETFADAHRPDTVLHVGEPWASRVVNEWLGDCGAQHVVVDPHGSWPDPLRVARSHRPRTGRGRYQRSARRRLGRLVVHGRTGAPNWRSTPRSRSTTTSPASPHSCAGWSGDLPDGTTLFVASSMPIRDVEWMGAPRHGLRVLANRGANGIDGLVSTAAGLARGGAGGPVVALLGDLALLHDVGGLRAAAGVDGLRYVVVDNDGGGIFDFLPQARELDVDVFDRLFTTPHGLDIGVVVAGVPGVDVEIVRTDRAASVSAYSAVHKAVAAALQ